jgi:uncharacterized protein
LSSRQPRDFRRRAAFLDTSAFYALADPTDESAIAARRIARLLHTQRWQLITTNFIRAEAHALLLKRLGHATAAGFLRELWMSQTTTLVGVTEADEDRALDLIFRYQDKNFTVVDATSFVVMERLGIRHAFSFDRDFAQYGMTILTADAF